MEANFALLPKAKVQLPQWTWHKLKLDKLVGPSGWALKAKLAPAFYL